MPHRLAGWNASGLEVFPGLSTEVIRYLHERSGGAFPIIGVGGIMTPEDAIEKLEAGASLVQVYTGFIYQGPSFARRIVRALDAWQKKEEVQAS